MSLLKLKGIHHLMIRLHTLHSTMSLLKPDPLESDPVPGDFTFHYVSIKTLHYLRKEDCWFSLHSTMSLLKRDPNGKQGQVSIFTFHYVSIKTHRRR